MKLSFAIAALAIAATVIVSGQTTAKERDSSNNVEDVIRGFTWKGFTPNS